MGEPRGGLGLTREAFPDLLAKGDFRGQDLDGDPSLELHVTGAIHDAHAAPPDLTFNLVRSGQDVSKS